MFMLETVQMKNIFKLGILPIHFIELSHLSLSPLFQSKSYLFSVFFFKNYIQPILSVC